MFQMFEVDSYMLCLELSNLDIFHRILKANYSQLRLLQYFQVRFDFLTKNMWLSFFFNTLMISGCN